MTWTERKASHSIEIPLKNSNEVVEVFLDELPDDPSEIHAIISGEAATLDLYLYFAVLIIQLNYTNLFFHLSPLYID